MGGGIEGGRHDKCYIQTYKKYLLVRSTVNKLQQNDVVESDWKLF